MSAYYLSVDTAPLSPLEQAQQAALAAILAPECAPEQPPLSDASPLEVTAAIGSLALGGAERIVLDWAAGCSHRYRVRLIVLRDAPAEWPVPRGVEIVRRAGETSERLEREGARTAAGGNPVVLCHLLTVAERRALERGGARAVPVLHNAPAGWIEPVAALADAPLAIAVSRNAAMELRRSGARTPCAVIRHVPPAVAPRPGARREWRERWGLPGDAIVIGMIGAVKPQKSYPRALRILEKLLARRDAYLVIVGGPVGRDGLLAWHAVLAQARRLGIERHVRLPGFVRGAADCLPAFDLLLNTSRYEGLSVATLEALAAGLPVVASAVGGQGELPAPGLTLVPYEAPETEWARAADEALGRRPEPPAWRGAATHRLWTLFHLLRPYEPGDGCLFVTANLNAGGAQRSLVNLALGLGASARFEIAVCGNSSSDWFSLQLAQAGVRVHRSAASRDCYDHAEAILRRAIAGRFGTVCFWNVDAKVKLLLAKALDAVPVKLIDVSPGGYAFREMEETRAFQQWIAWSEDEYYARLDRLVMKYRGSAPAPLNGKVEVIPNGVPEPEREKVPDTFSPRIVMSGRIAPSKFLVEAVAAMRLLWQRHPRAELHVLGGAERRHAEYARELLAAIGTGLDARVFLHGAAFDAPARLAGAAAVLVLGEHQGCPNAVLEALAAGVPVVANDSGGTRELVVAGRTGLLLSGRDPREIAAALCRILDDPGLARNLSEAGRRHARSRFSMARMVAAYRALFEENKMPFREVSCSH